MKIPFKIQLFFVFLLSPKLVFGQSDQKDSLGKIRYEIFCRGCMSIGAYFGFTDSLVLITNKRPESYSTHRGYDFSIHYHKDSALSLRSRFAKLSAYLSNSKDTSSDCSFMDSSNFTKALYFEGNDTNIYKFRLTLYDFYDSTSVKEIRPLKGYKFPIEFIPPSQISTIKFIPPSPRKKPKKKKH